jgi:bacillithiol biosynthesis cysteine-adding enzyme BshC
MIKTTIEPECTGQFSNLFLDYIHHKESLGPFYDRFPTIENFEKKIKERQFDQFRRDTLVQTLKQQYQGVEPWDLTVENLDSLKDSHTFTVTTGHQLNLFTGPLYFIYKIVSTINLAKRLNVAYPNYRFVPVYWMASEDHDFDEINHFHLDGEKFQWNSRQTGPVGKFQMDKELQDLLIKAHFAPDFLKKAYLEQNNLSGAVRHYINYLFGEQGLVILDPDNRDLKSIFVPVIKDDVFRYKAKMSVDLTTEKLEQLGYKNQIVAREINFFFMDQGIRERIERVEDTFQVLGTDLTFTENQMMDLIDNFPEKLSPNVVMRPLYQEYILPNLAYIGGPAEVAYWLQLKGIFDHYQTPFPMVMPRNFLMVLDKVAQRKVEALKLNEKEIFMDYVLWKKQYVLKNSDQDITLQPEKEKLNQIFEDIAQKGKLIDPTLKNSARAAHSRAMKILDQFSEKLRKAEERHMVTALGQMKDLKERLFPGGSPQERKENFLRFYLEDDTFLEELYDHLDPFDFNFIMLRI